ERRRLVAAAGGPDEKDQTNGPFHFGHAPTGFTVNVVDEPSPDAAMGMRIAAVTPAPTRPQSHGFSYQRLSRGAGGGRAGAVGPSARTISRSAAARVTAAPLPPAGSAALVSASALPDGTPRSRSRAVGAADGDAVTVTISTDAAPRSAARRTIASSVNGA